VKARWPMLLMAAALVAIAGLALAFPDLMLSPGALQPAHAALSERCLACHAPGRGPIAERCTSCHDPAAIGLRTTGGLPIVHKRASGEAPPREVNTAFHRELMEQDCVACHGEHEPAALLPRSRRAFSHELVRAPTRDRCEACHAVPPDELHKGRALACGSCHTTVAWKPATFDHERHFVLDRRHDVACATCHVGGDYQRYNCYGCHAHTPENVRAQHEEEGVRSANLDRCVPCHRSASGEGGEGGEGGGGDDD